MEGGCEALDLAADGGFVDAGEAGDLGEGGLVEEVGGEQEPVVWREGEDGLGEGGGQLGEGLGVGGWGEVWGGIVVVVERQLAVSATVLVDEALGERGAQPDEEGAASGVGGERGFALGVAVLVFTFAEAEEFGVEGVGEVLAEGGGMSGLDGEAGEGFAVAGDEVLPAGVAAEGAGLGEGEIREVEPAEETGLLGEAGLVVGGEAEVAADAGGEEDGLELGLGEGVGIWLGDEPELGEQLRWELG